MNTTAELVIQFALFTAASLGVSALFVTRLERVGARLGLSEAVLGLLAALGADTPEITSSITAIVHHQHDVAVGVVFGSNIFNLAALLGLAALSTGRIALHRRVVALAGLPAILVAILAFSMQHRVIGVWPVALVLFGIFIPYTVMSETPTRFFRIVHMPQSIAKVLLRALVQEERDLESVIAPQVGSAKDVYVALSSLVVVVGASVEMERLASTIGQRGHWSTFIIGGVVLAGVTSLPNAVAGIYLAYRGRGAAALSTAMHSNILNVIAGLVIPALFLGIGAATREGSLLVLWYLVITAATLVISYWRRGIGRLSGSLIIALYLFCLFNVIHR